MCPWSGWDEYYLNNQVSILEETKTTLKIPLLQQDLFSFAHLICKLTALGEKVPNAQKKKLFTVERKWAPYLI